MKKCIMKLISFLLRNKKRKRQSRIKKCNPTEQVNHFLQTGYAFRYNRLTEETEYRPIGIADKAFLPVSKRELNSLCLEAHARGILCWDKDISRFLFPNTYRNIILSCSTLSNFPLGTVSTGLTIWHTAYRPNPSG